MLEFHFCVATLDFGLSLVRQVQYWGGVGLSLLRGRCYIVFEKATTVIGGGCAVAVFGVIAHCPQVPELKAISTHTAPDGSRYSSTDVT